MIKINAQIKGNEITLIAVKKGEKVGRIRRELGLDVGECIAIRIGGFDADVEDADEFEWAYPETAKALKNAGVDITGLVAVMEVQK